MEKLTTIRLFKISFIGATNNRPSRVKIEDQRFNDKIVMPFDYSFYTIYDQAQNYLISKGIKILNLAEGRECYYLTSDNFETSIKGEQLNEN